MSEQRAVVITGASTGIGEACARRLDQIGFRVFAGVRKPEDGRRLQNGASERLMPVIMDVTDADSIRAARDLVAAALGEGGLAGLVNNAGVAISGPLEFLPLDDLRRQLEVNVVGQVAVIQAFMLLLRKSRGRIVNMSSIGGLSAIPFVGAYCASKFALEAISDSLRMELHGWGLHVSIIEPGAIATPIWGKGVAIAEGIAQNAAPQAWDYYEKSMEVLRRYALRSEKHGLPPEVVARAVTHALTAARPRARYLVGRDARLRAMLRLLPTRIADRLYRRVLQLNR